MSFIDGTAVNVTLPVMQRELGATSADMQWVVEGYALFLSALILIGGSLGDVLGRRRMFVLGIVIFALASVACALAPNVAVLVAARCVQGIGGALAMPESLALISAVYDGDERGRAIGLWSGFASITAAAGPVLGGFLAQHASWRYVFVINIPIAVAVVAIGLLRVPESRDAEGSRTIDTTGAALATLGLGALVYGLIHAQGGHFDAIAVGTILLGCAALGLFVVAERRERHPMMPLAMFASRTFSVANLYTLLLYAALSGSLYFLPFALIGAQRYDPQAAGAALLPFVVLQFALSRWSGGLVGRLGARTPLVLGALLAAGAFVLFSLPGIGGGYWTTYFPAAVLLGLGGALFIAPLTTTVFDSTAREHSGIASGINNAVARTAGLVAVALFGIAQVAVFDRELDARLAQHHVSSDGRRIAVEQRAKLSTGVIPQEVPAADRRSVDGAVRQASLDGFRAVMLLSALVALLAAALALLALPARTRPL